MVPAAGGPCVSWERKGRRACTNQGRKKRRKEKEGKEGGAGEGDEEKRWGKVEMKQK